MKWQNMLFPVLTRHDMEAYREIKVSEHIFDDEKILKTFLA
jgi:hypothetical protein